MPKVNPEILVWARKTAGMAPDDAVKKLGIKDARGVEAVDRLAALEDGTEQPTRPILVKMAKQYRRPLLTFYLSEKPRTGDRGQDYRTLPDGISLTDAALADAVIRDIKARQALVKAVLVDEEEAETLHFIGTLNLKDGIKKAVESITTTLKFDLQEYRAKPRIDDAFTYLRELTEAAGIFVLLVDHLGSHHSTIDVEVFRGFALADDTAPFIAINANDSKGAWVFTLLHELAHLWLGETGVSGGLAEQRIEKHCNDIASEFLLPKAELVSLRLNDGVSFEETKKMIVAFAEARNVSRTMVAYKLYRSGAYDFERFCEFRNAFRKDFINFKAKQKERDKQKDGGPTYHNVRQHRAGPSLIGLVERMLYSGAITTTKAGKVLGVKGKNVEGLIKAGTRKRPIELLGDA